MAKPLIGGQRKKNKCTIGYSCGTTCIDPDFECEKEVQSEGGKRVARNMTAMAKQISGKAGGGGAGASEGASAQLAKIREAENKIRDKSFETGILFDSNGKEIWKDRGTKNAVDIRPLYKMDKSQLADAVFTHNHPKRLNGADGGSFSAADIQVSHALGLKGVRAVTENYEYNINVNQNLPTNWINTLAQRHKEIKSDLIASEMPKIKARQKELYRQMINEGGITVEEADKRLLRLAGDGGAELLHKVNLQMAEEYDYEYTRTKI